MPAGASGESRMAPILRFASHGGLGCAKKAIGRGGRAERRIDFLPLLEMRASGVNGIRPSPSIPFPSEARNYAATQEEPLYFMEIAFFNWKQVFPYPKTDPAWMVKTSFSFGV